MMELLKLAALDVEDLAVISAHLQDAILRAEDLAGLPGEHRFALAARRFDWSMRSLHRTLKVARTIADLAQRPVVEGDDVAEAVGLRRQLEPVTPPVMRDAA